MLAAVYRVARHLPSSFTSTFAIRLKAARALRGVSQRALGGMLTGEKNKGGVRINRYEQGVNRADTDSIAEIARVLGVPMSFLFAASEEEADLLLAFSALPPAQRSALLQLARQMNNQVSEGGSANQEG